MDDPMKLLVDEGAKTYQDYDVTEQSRTSFNGIMTGLYHIGNGSLRQEGLQYNATFHIDPDGPSGNYSYALQHPTFNEMSLIKTIVLSAMFVISLVGNTATLVQMFRMRRRRSTINTLIMNLAVADLFVTFFCNVTDAVWASTVQWLAGNAMCKLVKFLQVFGLYLSTYIIVIISIDRCYAILDPMSRNSAPKRVRVLIILAWIISALFSSPQVSIQIIMLRSHCASATPIFTAILWFLGISIVQFRVNDFCSNSKNRCDSTGFCTHAFCRSDFSSLGEKHRYNRSCPR